MYVRSVHLILSAGMPRSGSTWLYNVIRLLISNSPQSVENFISGWVNDFDNVYDLKKASYDKYILIKIHNYDEALVNQADYIFILIGIFVMLWRVARENLVLIHQFHYLINGLNNISSG